MVYRKRGKQMRKCLITTNIKTERTDAQLQELWKDELEKYNNGIPGGIGLRIDPTIDSLQKRSFMSSNKSYWENKETLGLFHQWGNDFEEFESGAGNYTVAIVELDDGTVVTHAPDKITFLPPEAKGFEEFARMGHQNLGRMMF
jgi:hypothetical protein